MGIGRPDSGRDVVGYVLSSFTPDEKSELQAVLTRAAKGLRLFTEQGCQAAMNACH
jgi:peptidyl-tRNA hydrolase